MNASFNKSSLLFWLLDWSWPYSPAAGHPPDKGKKKDLCYPSFAPPHNLESCIVQGISK